MEAMRQNDEPTADHGIAVAFRFASPSNRMQTGPLPRFALMVKNALYRPMLNFKTAEYAQPDSIDGRVRVNVCLLDSEGEAATFDFFLSQQVGGRYHGCWMTDAVVRK